MSGPGKVASSNTRPGTEYSVRYGCPPQPTITSPSASSCVSPWVAVSSVGECVYCLINVAVCAVVSGLSSRPREGPAAAANCPGAITAQQASSNTLTTLPEWSSTSCCHWNDAPDPNVK